MSEGQTSTSVKFNRKKLGIIGAVLLILVTLIVGISIYNSPTNRLSRLLDLGNRYLEEQNYEQAIVEFDKAIAIDPMSAEAYMGKADAYIGLGDLQAVLDTLLTGYDLTGDERLKEKLDEIEVQLMQIRQAEEEARLAAEEEEAGNEIKRLVDEKWEELAAVHILCVEYYQYGNIHISDAQVKELASPLADLLEQYKALFPDDYETWRWLPSYYFLLGEYELCLETRKQIHELQLAYWEQVLGSDPELYPYEYAPEVTVHRTPDYIRTYDEYGRAIKLQDADDESIVWEYEFGGNGKKVQEISYGYHEDGSVWRTTVETYEYDSLGRLSKHIITEHNDFGYMVSDSTSTSTYTYNKMGYEEHVYTVHSSGKVSECIYEFELDKYGEYTQIAYTEIQSL